MEQRWAQTRRQPLEPTDHRVTTADLVEHGAVVIERQHPRQLPVQGARVAGHDRARDTVGVRTNLDGTVVLVALAVEAEGEPHHAVEAVLVAVAEPHRCHFRQREPSSGPNHE